MDNILKFSNEKNWYFNINKSIKKKYKKDSILFSGLLSATSPRFQVKRNFNTTEIIFNDYKKIENFVEYFKNNKNEVKKKYKIMDAHYFNVIRALENANKKGLELSGNKVNAFYQNLIGNYGIVTIDVWMLRLFKHKKTSCNKSEYKQYSNCVKSVRRKLKRLYKLDIDNAGIQAILWQFIRHKEGFKPSNFNKWI